MKTKILYVDDDGPNLDAFYRVFRFDYEVLKAGSGAEGLGIVRNNPDIAVIVSDQRMPGMTGVEFLENTAQLLPYTQRIMLTAYTDNEALILSIQKGHVYDYVVKPWSRETLGPVLNQAVKLYEDRIEKIKKLRVAETKNSVLETEIRERFCFDEIIGAEGDLATLVREIKKIAPTNSSVFIRGESGAGKELVARAVHNNSTRKNAAFVRVNCAALSPTLLESELFGHEKGAFTGASALKKGRFELADGGTLFLDEVGDLPEAVQVKLLRVLQEKEFERVGGTALIKTDFRLITATHQNMEQIISAGKFREDLFFRLNVIPIFIPPLRERKNDITRLAQYFTEKFSNELGKTLILLDDATLALKEYDWPGNIRELSNVIERAAVLTSDGQITAADLSQNLVATNQMVREASQQKYADLRDNIQNDEAKELSAVLKNAKGNISEAARIMNLPRSTLVHRLKKCEIIS